MTVKENALFSHYIIDGARMDMSPAELLEECTEADSYDFPDGSSFEDIIDESTEPPLSSFSYNPEREKEYLTLTTAAAHEERPFRMLYPEHFTRLQISKALLSRLWSKGHFKLGNLKLWAQWEWDTTPTGNMSAFYRSVESASEYIYGLGVNLEDYIFLEGNGSSNVKFYAWLDKEYDREYVQGDGRYIQGCHAESGEAPAILTTLFKSSPYESRHPWIGEERACSSTVKDDPKSWILYIPFDTCGFRIGASLLTEVAGHEGGKAPDLSDPDYFIDGYEVIRELVEDGIILAGATVADGGLITTLNSMCNGCGMDIDIKGILSSYNETSRERVIFGEIPGVVIQISDENYDYVDSQLLLQDIAYYPIGHPSGPEKELVVSDTGKNGVADILVSLLGHASEGED